MKRGKIEGKAGCEKENLSYQGHKSAKKEVRVIAFREVMVNGGGGVDLQDGKTALQGVEAEIEPEALFFIGELLCFNFPMYYYHKNP